MSVTKSPELKKTIAQRLLFSSLAKNLSAKSREAKISEFAHLLHQHHARKVLDIGSGIEWYGASNTIYEIYNGHPSLDLFAAAGIEGLWKLKEKYQDIAFVNANGLALPFKDKAFDLSFSNAVIEHILPIEQRRIFIFEMLRVSKVLFLTTPNKWFPFEVHSRLPLTHWTPRVIHNFVLRLIGLDNLQRGVYFEPISRNELFKYFPPHINPQIQFGYLGMTLIAIYTSKEP